MAESKPKASEKTQRRTIAQVDQDIAQLREAQSNLDQKMDTGFAQIIDILREKEAEQVNKGVQAQVQYNDVQSERKFHQDLAEMGVPLNDTSHVPEQRTKVGERPGDRIIRNLNAHFFRMRLGKENDPFRVELQGRGRDGDIKEIPASLTGDPIYRRNLVKGAFEEISQEMAEALQQQYWAHSDAQASPYGDVELVQDRDRTIATMQEQQVRGLGPRYVDVPGSDQQIAAQARAATDPRGDPEYQKWLAQKTGLAAPDPNDPRTQRPAPTQQRDRRSVLEDRARGGDPEALAMVRRLREAEAKGVLPKGELDKPVTMERTTVSVQPNVPPMYRRD